uniref:SUN domain-containing protein n=1 Tax=Homalodisca liturata TaxID=320908 RepID=A0A1B6IL46_9HEMI
MSSRRSIHQTQSQTETMSPNRSSRRKNQITETSQENSVQAELSGTWRSAKLPHPTPITSYTEGRSAFTCLPRHQLLGARRSSKLTHPTPIISYTEDDELYKQWGFPCPRKKDRLHVPISNGEQKMKEDYQKPVLKESSRINWQSVKYIAALISLIVVSGFLGAYCYAYINYHYFQDSRCVFSNHHSLDVVMKDDRYSHLDLKIQKISSCMAELAKNINALRGKISKPPEIETKVIAIPPRGIWEELFTSEPDLASAGNFGSVLATPDTTSHIEAASLSVFSWLSFNIHLPHYPPQTTIQGLILEVGDCWAFKGQQGRLVLGLIRPSLLSSVSISHIPFNLSPSGDIISAPKLFQVLVHRSQDLENGITVGEFEYNKAGPWRQKFNLNTDGEETFDIVEFRFLSNHGHPNYTCVYRVHVHGKMIFA